MHLGYSRVPLVSSFLQCFSVISTSGRLLIASLEAGGVPDLPLSCIEILIICSSKLSLTEDLKLKSNGLRPKSSGSPPIAVAP